MRKLLVPLSIIALTVIGCQKNDAHENVLHDEILEWTEQYLAWDMSGVGEKPTPLLISKNQLDAILNDVKMNEPLPLRSRAMLQCLGVAEGVTPDDEECEKSLTQASLAGDISAEVLEKMVLEGGNDPLENKDFYEDRAKNGNTFAQLLMVELAEESDDDLATLPWLEMSLENGNVRAIYEIWLQTKEQDAVKSKEKAIAQYENVAGEVNNLPSQNLISLRKQAVLDTGYELIDVLIYENDMKSTIRVLNAMKIAHPSNAEEFDKHILSAKKRITD